MHSVIILRYPGLFKISNIRMNIVKNSTQTFYVQGKQLKVLSLSPIESNCAGLFYDYQRVIETTANSKGCGCYSMKPRRVNIVTTHNIKFSYKSGENILSTEDLTSLKFGSLF